MGLQFEDRVVPKTFHDSTNIIISNLPKEATARSIQQFAEEVGAVNRCFLVRDKEHVFTGMAYVSYTTAECAKEAVTMLNQSTFDDETVTVKHSQAKKKKYESDGKSVPIYTIKDRPPREQDWQDRRNNLKLMRSKMQNGRIVVRNINRGSTEKGIRTLFGIYGEILELVILKLADGRPKGVLFVQYGSAMHASAAISKCNGTKFMGKTIAVDLAVPRDVYQGNESKSDDKIPVIKIEPLGDDKESRPNITRFDDDGDQIKKEDYDEDGGITAFGGDQKSDDDNQSERDEEIEKKKELDNLLSQKGKRKEYVKSNYVHKDQSNNSKERGLTGSGGDQSESDEEIEKKKELDNLLTRKEKRKEYVKSNFVHKAQSSDVVEKRSIFIRSIAYDCNESTIEKLLTKYGEVKHVLFCNDRATQRFKGTAFAQFKTKEGSDACLEAYDDPAYKKDFLVNGRTLYMSLAIGRDEIHKAHEVKVDTKKSKTKDKRNLYLAKEGLIKEGTKAADGLSKTDLMMRKQRASISKKMLQNLHIFVSKTRLSIHNLDLTLSDGALRKLCMANAPEGAEIDECRIMRNMYELDDDNRAKSKGYGFVTFTQHDHALAALRSLNNNPDIFDPRNRPIVEFSLENRAALNAKARRLQISKEKNPTTSQYKEIEKEKLENPPEEQEADQTNSVYTPQSYAGNQSNPGKKGMPKKITRNQINNMTRRQMKGSKTKYALKKTKTGKRKSKGGGGPAKKKRKA